MSDPITPPPIVQPSSSRPRKRSWLIPTLTGFSGLLVGGAAGLFLPGLIPMPEDVAAEAEVKPIFAEARKACLGDPANVEIADRGATMIVNMKGDDETMGLDAKYVWCIVDELKAPRSVVSHMEQTTSMDGRQTEQWDNLEVSWSYHPDRGMDSVWKLVSQP